MFQHHKVKRSITVLIALVVIAALLLLFLHKRDYNRRIYYNDGSGGHVLDGFTYDEANLKTHLPRWCKDFCLTEDLVLELEKEFDSFQIFKGRIEGICFLHIVMYYYETDEARSRADILIWQDEALKRFYTDGNVYEFDKAVEHSADWMVAEGQIVSYFEYPPEYLEKYEWGYGVVSDECFTAYVFSPNMHAPCAPEEKKEFYVFLAKTALQFMKCTV